MPSGIITIRFENDTQATAPARIVRITAPVQSKQDPATFELGSFGFNNQSFDVPAATSAYYQRLDCRDPMKLYVDVTAGYDQVANRFFWEFQSIDPLTLLPSDEPLAGRLFLQDAAHPDGHGFVNFSVKPLTSAHTPDTIGAKASVVFDANEPLATNVHTNAVDAVAPTSGITGLPKVSPNTVVNLHLTGSDDAGGSGGVYSGANTPVLTLTAAPSSMYGYQYRCLVNGTTVSDAYLLKFGMTWQGTVSNSWENGANWSGGTLPDAYTDVIIDGGSERYPVVSPAAFVRSLQTLRASAVTVKTGYTLTVVK